MNSFTLGSSCLTSWAYRPATSAEITTTPAPSRARNLDIEPPGGRSDYVPRTRGRGNDWVGAQSADAQSPGGRRARRIDRRAGTDGRLAAVLRARPKRHLPGATAGRDVARERAARRLAQGRRRRLQRTGRLERPRHPLS